MPKKEIVTLKEIERDIKNSLKMGKEMSRSSYLKGAIPCAVLGVILGIISIFQPQIIVNVFLLLIAVVVGVIAVVGAIIEVSTRKHKRNSVRMDDYDVSFASLSHTEEEHYIETSHHYSRQVNIYTLEFEDGREWIIPKVNYTWSQEFTMSDFTISLSSHPGDSFIVVARKDTRDIVMAYQAEFFEYNA